MDLGRLRAIINDTPLTDLAACRTELDHVRIARAALDTRELEVMARPGGHITTHGPPRARAA